MVNCRRFAGPVAIGVGVERRLQTRLKVATDNFLGDSIRDSWNAPTGAYRHPPSEYPLVAPAAGSSSLTTADSRARRGCSKDQPPSPQSSVHLLQPLPGWPSPS